VEKCSLIYEESDDLGMVLHLIVSLSCPSVVLISENLNVCFSRVISEDKNWENFKEK